MIIFLGLFYLAILAVGLRFLIHGYGLMGNFLRRARPTNRLQGQPEARCNSMPCHCGCCYATCLVQGVALHLASGRALLFNLPTVERCLSPCKQARYYAVRWLWFYSSCFHRPWRLQYAYTAMGFSSPRANSTSGASPGTRLLRAPPLSVSRYTQLMWCSSLIG